MSATKGNTSLTFTYDDTGLLSTRTKNGVTTRYYYSGTQLVAEVTPTYIIGYLYEADGSPVGMTYRDTTASNSEWEAYWYEKNLFGDIVAIYSETGTRLATYKYTSAWGGCYITYENGGANTHAGLNPFRYRGYYFDSDMYLYRTQTRYYSSSGRFISPDDVGYLGANGDLNSYNLYAYCSNNPVMYTDPSGHSILGTLLIGALVGAIINVAVSASVAKFNNEDYTANNLIVDAVSGAISGAFATTGLSAIVQGVVGFTTGYLSSISLDLLNGEEINYTRASNAAALSGLASYMCGAGLDLLGQKDIAAKSLVKIIVKESGKQLIKGALINAFGMYIYDYINNRGG